MDSPQQHPRLSVYKQYYSSASANSQANVSAVVSDVPLVPNKTFGPFRPYVKPEVFEQNAKTFRRSRVKGRVFKIFLILFILLILIVAALGAVGYTLNSKYKGRALPYTYVGNLSVGGLTQPEIKQVLDTKSKEVRVTLVEAGLTRDVPVDVFGAQFDTQKASEQAITGFNPFSYLQKRVFTVPAEVDEQFIDGFIRLYVADKQTKSENARIIKSKKDLVVVPEIAGFRTNTDYVAQQLREQLPKLEDPVINLSTVTDKPNITAADLAGDIEKAKNLISGQAGVRVYNTVIRPKEEQKLSWLDIKEVPGTNGVQIMFSKTKVREYVSELAQKYTNPKVDETIINNPDGSQTVSPGKNGQKVKNLDEVANKLYTALSNQQNIEVAFEFEQEPYVAVDRSKLISPKLEAPVVDGASNNLPNSNPSNLPNTNTQTQPANP
ncbi:MAG: peptidoglycan binding domain-containing protein [Patescibacteria group bacterium]|nr:peptidoglycan binding domain-containing protein [Patescibacteria group bacterium]